MWYNLNTISWLLGSLQFMHYMQKNFARTSSYNSGYNHKAKLCKFRENTGRIVLYLPQFLFWHHLVADSKLKFTLFKFCACRSLKFWNSPYPQHTPALSSYMKTGFYMWRKLHLCEYGLFLSPWWHSTSFSFLHAIYF